MIDEGTYEKLANANANAVLNMKPQISIWTKDSGSNAVENGLTQLLQSIPPVFQTIEQQTGMKLFPSLVSSA